MRTIFSATLVILGVAASGCDKKEDKPATPSATPAKASASASASAAPSAAPSAKPAEPKGSGKTKGGGKDEAKAAIEEKQKTGAKIKDMKDKAKKQAGEVDSIACTDEIDGAGFCDDENKLFFCLEKTWYVLECKTALEGSFCGYDEANDIVDCWAEGVFGDDDDDTGDDDDDGETKEG